MQGLGGYDCSVHLQRFSVHPIINTATQTRTTNTSIGYTSLAPSNAFQLLIAQLQGLLRLILEPIRLAHIKTSLFCQCYSGIKVGSTLEFLLKPRIIFEFGKQGCELLF